MDINSDEAFYGFEEIRKEENLLRRKKCDFLHDLLLPYGEKGLKCCGTTRIPAKNPYGYGFCLVHVERIALCKYWDWSDELVPIVYGRYENGVACTILEFDLLDKALTSLLRDLTGIEHRVDPVD